jgi:hypothetical protein
MHHSEAFDGRREFHETSENDERKELIEESIENFRLKPFAELNRIAKIISSLHFIGKPEEYINFPDPKRAGLERLKDKRPDTYTLTPEASGEMIQNDFLDELHSIKIEIPPHGRLTPNKLEELSNRLRQIFERLPEF